MASRGVAEDKKSARRQRAHLVLIDESGFLMSPLVRRTLAPRGHTPILKTRAAHREKVSITAALTISPKQKQLGLYWRTYPRSFVNAQRAADFLRYLLQRLRGKVIVVWDGGPMHKGEPIRQILHDFPRLHLERLPPYAPDLNPVEYLWGYIKYGKLPNFLPADVFQLDATLNGHMAIIRNSPERLVGYFDAAKLPFR
jgi:transposase